jgi:hypothetical protein
MTPQVPTRLVRRDLLAGAKRPNGTALSRVVAPTVGATATLPSPRNGRAAVDAHDGSHDWILWWDALCHRHFSTVANFDAHQPNYAGCLTPDDITDRDGKPRLKPVEGRYGTTWVLAKERPAQEEMA